MPSSAVYGSDRELERFLQENNAACGFSLVEKTLITLCSVELDNVLEQNYFPKFFQISETS